MSYMDLIIYNFKLLSGRIAITHVVYYLVLLRRRLWIDRRGHPDRYYRLAQ
jgi:hypothetical protein